jgi:hypothetical protein
MYMYVHVYEYSCTHDAVLELEIIAYKWFSVIAVPKELMRCMYVCMNGLLYPYIYIFEQARADANMPTHTYKYTRMYKHTYILQQIVGFHVQPVVGMRVIIRNEALKEVPELYQVCVCMCVYVCMYVFLNVYVYTHWACVS